MDVLLGWLKELATGKKKKVFWAAVIIVLVVVWAVYPFLDASFFVHNRVAKRIENMEKLIAIEGVSRESRSVLLSEYESIVSEIESARVVRENGIFYRNDTANNFWLKFIGGALLGFILAIYGIFYKETGTIGTIILTKLVIIVMGIFIGTILGFLFTMLPVLGNAWVNLILAPIIQIFVLAILCSD